MVLSVLGFSKEISSSKRNALGVAHSPNVIFFEVKLQVLLLFLIEDVGDAQCVIVFHQTAESLSESVARGLGTVVANHPLDAICRLHWF